MDKTLYVSENPTIRIRRDGPSLWIEQDGSAGRRIPARLIRRVIIRGNVSLDSGSLLLFTERGVPITLIRQDGRCRAVVLPIHGGNERRRARQRSTWEDPEKRERLVAWLAAWEHGRRVALITRLDPSQVRLWKHTGFRGEDYDAWLAERFDLCLKENGERAFAASLLFEYILAHVTGEGWDPHVGIRHAAGPLGFVHDVTDALGAEADRVWIDAMSRGPAPLATSYSLVRECERARPRLDKLLRTLLRQYERILWEP